MITSASLSISITGTDDKSTSAKDWGFTLVHSLYKSLAKFLGSYWTFAGTVNSFPLIVWIPIGDGLECPFSQLNKFSICTWAFPFAICADPEYSVKASKGVKHNIDPKDSSYIFILISLVFLIF